MNRKRWIHRRLVVSSVVMMALPAVTSAQQTATKRPLTYNDYGSWKSIQSQKLAGAGRFLALALMDVTGPSATASGGN